MNKEKIELLNSEGPILVLKKKILYELKFQQLKETMVVDKKTLMNFLSGKTSLETHNGKVWDYSSFSDGMKPNQTDLDNFLNGE